MSSEGVPHNSDVFCLFFVVAFFVCGFVFWLKSGDYPITSQSGPPSARQRNAIKWRFAGGLILAQH